MKKVSISISLKTQDDRVYRTFMIGYPKDLHDNIDTLKQWFYANMCNWLKNEIGDQEHT